MKDKAGGKPLRLLNVIDVPHGKDLLADDYRKQAVSANKHDF